MSREEEDNRFPQGEQHVPKTAWSGEKAWKRVEGLCGQVVRAYCSVKEGLDDGALEVRVSNLDRR